MIYEVTIAGVTRKVDVERTSTGLRARLDGGPWQGVDATQTLGWLRLNGRRYGAHADHARVQLHDGAEHFVAEVHDPRDAALVSGGGAGEGSLRSPMPGAVVRVPVRVGDAVSAGQVVLVVEAMKMENEFKAPFDGVVSELAVAVGQAVEGGALLAVVSPCESP